MKDALFNNDTERRVTGHLMYPRTVSDIRKLLAEDAAQGVVNQDGLKHDEVDVPTVLRDLENRGIAKSFYGVNPYALVNIMQEDDDAITHPDNPDDIVIDNDGKEINYGGENRGEVWARRSMSNTATDVFQPDAPYYIMTKSTLEHFRTPGPDNPNPDAPHGPVVIGLGGVA